MTAEALGEGLLATLQKKHPYFAKRAEATARWLRDVAEPPDGVELKAADGSTFTGFVIVERSAPVVMLCIRHPAAPMVDRPPVVTPPPRAYERTVYEPEDQWDRNGDPHLR
jgi:hypothetical protein